jgi:nucleoid-associated protein YgaU
MQKDFKIGLFLGVIIAIAVVIWLCTLPRLSTIARAMQSSSDKNAPVETPAKNSQSVMQPVPAESLAAPAINNEQLTMNNNQSPRFHIVRKGDTLSKISEKYYGSPRFWQKILSANHDTLPDPNRLTPGIKLIIP